MDEKVPPSPAPSSAPPAETSAARETHCPSCGAEVQHARDGGSICPFHRYIGAPAAPASPPAPPAETSACATCAEWHPAGTCAATGTPSGPADSCEGYRAAPASPPGGAADAAPEQHADEPPEEFPQEVENALHKYVEACAAFDALCGPPGCNAEEAAEASGAVHRAHNALTFAALRWRAAHHAAPAPGGADLGAMLEAFEEAARADHGNGIAAAERDALESAWESHRGAMSLLGAGLDREKARADALERALSESRAERDRLKANAETDAAIIRRYGEREAEARAALSRARGDLEETLRQAEEQLRLFRAADADGPSAKLDRAIARVESARRALAQETPAAERIRAREQPCGCVVCTCRTEDRCLGCGAKNCGTPSCVFKVGGEVYVESAPAGTTNESANSAKRGDDK